MDGGINLIQHVYESINVCTSVLICENPQELDYYVQSMESKCFTCVFLNTQEHTTYHNKVIVTLPKQFHSDEFWDIITSNNVNIDCVFFSNKSIACEYIDVCTEHLNEKKKYFIFTL